MAKNNFFLHYTPGDEKLAQRVAEILRQREYSVFCDTGAEDIEESIYSCDYYIGLITDQYLLSQSAQCEMDTAMLGSLRRGKPVIQLIDTSRDSLSVGVRDIPSRCHRVYFRVGGREDYHHAIRRVDAIAGYDLKSAELYEMLKEYHNMQAASKEAEIILQLIELLYNRFSARPTASKKEVIEACRLLKQIERIAVECSNDIGMVFQKIADQLHRMLQPMVVDRQNNRYLKNLFMAAYAVRLQYVDWFVYARITNLSAYGGAHKCLEQYIDKQQQYVHAFESLLAEGGATLDTNDRYTPEEIEFIKQTPLFYLTAENARSILDTHEEVVTYQTEDEEILQSVAKFMQEGNKLFDVLQQRGIAGDFLKCLLTSYERLKNYCQIVGAKDVAADCVERIVDIRNRLDQQSDAPASNETAEKGIKSLLGFTLNTGDHYDVFISFKNEDADLAEKVYQLCQRHLKVPFWSKRSLPELSASDYEAAIYEALDRSTHFVVVLSKLEYLQSDWVKEEMNTFHRELNEGRKPDQSNFIFVVTDDLYDAIIRNNKKDLPIQYRGYQIVKMSEYQDLLVQYIK